MTPPSHRYAVTRCDCRYSCVLAAAVSWIDVDPWVINQSTHQGRNNRVCLTPRLPQPQILTDALHKTIELLKLPENVAKMDSAKAQMAAQPDNVMLLMMMVLPVATSVLAPILMEFKFPADQGGLMMFMSAVTTHKGDSVIAGLGKEMRSAFVPESLEQVVNAMLSGGGM